jgi:hypothetical protein
MAEPGKTPNGESEQKQEEQPKAVNGKPSVTLAGTVEKVIHSIHPSEPDKAQIAIEGAEELYREIRVPNTLQNGSGQKVPLEQGAEVDVTIQADANATTEKTPPDASQRKKAEQDGKLRNLP